MQKHFYGVTMSVITLLVLLFAVTPADAQTIPGCSASNNAPDNMTGKSLGDYYYKISGTTFGSGWGGGGTPYTDNSDLATMAVHSGAVDNNQSAIVKVTVSAGLNSYTGNTQNGVTTSSYGAWGGSYTVVSFDRSCQPTNGTLTVKKSSGTLDGTFTFTGNTGITSLTTVNGTAQQSVSLAAGTYNIAEVVSSGWTLGVSVCNNGILPGVIIVAGQTTICTFHNQSTSGEGSGGGGGGTGTLKIIKNTTDGDGTFSYNIVSSASPAPFPSSVTTTGGTGSQSTQLDPTSTYSITETIPADWTLTSSSCTNGTPAAITIVAGQTTTCTFNNTYSGGGGGDGTLTVITNAAGGSVDFNFTGNTGITSITTSSGTGQQTVSNLTAGTGTYNIAEVVPSGWTLTNSSCTNGTPSAINIVAGENTVCTFNNSPAGTLGTLIIKKNTIGGEGTFSYSIVASGSSAPFPSSVTTTGGTGSQSIQLDPTSTYSITETILPDWTFVVASCDHAYTARTNGVTNVAVVAGQTTTCTFGSIGSEEGGLTIIEDSIKYTNILGTGLVITWETNLPSSSYVIYSEEGRAIPINLTDASGTPPKYGYTNATKEINIDPKVTSHSVTISGLTNGLKYHFRIVSRGSLAISNEYSITMGSGSLTIIKEAYGGDGDFTFIDNFPGNTHIGTLTTAGGTAQQTVTLPAGTSYNIAEAVPNGWTFVFADCDNAYTPATNGVTSMAVVNNGVTTCTFIDQKSTTPPSGTNLVINKYIIGAKGYVSFDINALTAVANSGDPKIEIESSPEGVIPIDDGNNLKVLSGETSASSTTIVKGLVPGQDAYYNIIESDPGIGWAQTYGYCSVSGEDNPIGTGTLIIKKNTIGGNGTFSYNIVSSASPTPFPSSVTTTDGSGIQSIPLDSTATYSITETIPADWTFNSASCDHAYTAGTNGVTNVAVAAGETTTCTFNNTSEGKGGSGDGKGTLTVIKNATGGNGTFTFTGNTGITSLKTVNGTAHQSVRLAATGTYDIAEVVPSEWTLEDSSCTNGTPSAINIVAGETTTCTFSNNKLGAWWNYLGAINNVKISYGKTTTCTFINTFKQPQSLKIVKNIIVPGGSPYLPSGDRLFGYNVIPFGSDPRFTSILTGATSGLPANQGIAFLHYLDPSLTYSIDETVPPGWVLTSVSCDNGSGTKTVNGITNITLGAHGTTCTFTDTKIPATVTINKVIIPSTDAGKFDLLINNRLPGNLLINGGPPQGTGVNVGNGGTTGPVLLPTGRYNLGESAGTGTKIDDYTLVYSGDCSEAGIIILETGDNKVCTMTNTRLAIPPPVPNATLSIRKSISANTVAGVGYNFYYDITGPVNLTGVKLTAIRNAANEFNGYGSVSVALPVGKYTVTERPEVPSDWKLKTASCALIPGEWPTGTMEVDENRMTDVEIIKDSFTLCSFDNVYQYGWLGISSSFEGGPWPGLDFNFYYDITGPVNLTGVKVTVSSVVSPSASTGSFTLPMQVPIGTYTITQRPDVSGDWKIHTIGCASGPASVGTYTPGAYDITAVPVIAGFVTGCNFSNNYQYGSLLITKNTEDGMSRTSEDVLNNATEEILSGTAGTAGTGGEPVFRTTGIYDFTYHVIATSGLALDRKIDFSATIPVKTGYVDFDFFTGFLGGGRFAKELPEGTYIITEIPPPGWSLFDAGSWINSKAATEGGSLISDPFCTAGKAQTSDEWVPGENFITGVKILPGSGALCAFVNHPAPSLAIIKKTTGGNGAFDFNISPTSLPTVSLPTVSITTRGTTTSGTGYQTVFVGSGTYSITETLPKESDWKLSSASCKRGADETPTGTFDLESKTIHDVVIVDGETTTCTFRNNKKPSLIPPSRGGEILGDPPGIPEKLPF